MTLNTLQIKQLHKQTRAFSYLCSVHRALGRLQLLCVCNLFECIIFLPFTMHVYAAALYSRNMVALHYFGSTDVRTATQYALRFLLFRTTSSAVKRSHKHNRWLA